MNQGKYDMVKQEMEQVNTDILGISELKLTGMGEFFFSFIFISWRLITLQYCSGFCHTLT